jgi:hypothetical protein
MMNMDKGYRHTQVGYVMMLSLAGAILLELGVFLGLSLWAGMSWPAFWIILGVVLLLVVMLVLFSTHTSIVDETTVTASFGPGLIRFSFALKDITSVKRVMNGWYYGYGVRSIRNGWLYNVSGLEAVEIELKSGRVYRIGTDEPEKLEKTIRRGMNGV